jgi:PadR family transcriptional regulator PadR
VGPQHGHGVGQAIRQSSVDLLQIERGSLYLALHRLEARGLITSEWKASDLKPAGEILPPHRGG